MALASFSTVGNRRRVLFLSDGQAICDSPTGIPRNFSQKSESPEKVKYMSF
jgi:hypothetical protein